MPSTPFKIVHQITDIAQAYQPITPPNKAWRKIAWTF